MSEKEIEEKILNSVENHPSVEGIEGNELWRTLGLPETSRILYREVLAGLIIAKRVKRTEKRDEDGKVVEVRFDLPIKSSKEKPCTPAKNVLH